jgi:hypothetical protein
MRAALLFIAAYTVALFVYGQAVDSPLTNVYTGITLLLLAFFVIVHRWARFPDGIWWAIALVGLGNMLGGVVLVGGEPLYMAPIGPVHYDKLFHAAAAFACFFVAWVAIQRWAGEGPHRGGLLFIAVLATMGGGAAVEIAELIGASVGDVNVGDYLNNALDLVANAVGALLAALLVILRGLNRVAAPERFHPDSP